MLFKLPLQTFIQIYLLMYLYRRLTMILRTDDGKRIIDIGTSDLWFCFYSTVAIRLSNIKSRIPDALEFMKNQKCVYSKCLETARQFNLIRDELSCHPVSDIVYNMNDPNQKAPWEGRISNVITSCGNFFTTADGKDLIFELTALLCYSAYSQSIIICE